MSNFDFNKIKDFDSHIQSSIPNYNELVDMVVSLSHHLVPDEGTVVDIGCSTGTVIEKIWKAIPNIECVGVDLARNLFPATNSAVVYMQEDVRTFTPKADLIILMFTLQFLTIAERKDLLSRIKKLNPHATLIVTEKTYMDEGKIQEMFTFSYYDFKAKTFTAEEMLQKQKSIRTIMKPLTQDENFEMFDNAGYRTTKFWQSFQFMGWILQ